MKKGGGKRKQAHAMGIFCGQISPDLGCRVANGLNWRGFMPGFRQAEGGH